ncbi:hypothetical protein [Azotobacter beijerinckii]|uniref:Uncharacterized protein n=1 Tax=Azotobacter beijerinckii TaxID=170623 RepID=A0A1I4GV01_9GAMM|nr:hypothetical protein [Azotobacter beijerinckii]SFL33922.1 hypothetical protein SAMN04244574_04003 [Azotobacter beijerinckii]
MSRMDRTGLRFGSLTVLDDSGASDQLRCVCDCGREGLYPRAISKPTYRGPLSCAWCRGSPCEICGEIVPAKGRRQAATCSEPCRAERIKRKGREYYLSVRNTPRWLQLYRERCTKHRQRMRDDPEYATQFNEANRRRLAAYRARLNLDPARREAMLQRKRAIAARARCKLQADPAAHEAHKERQRRWYRALSPEDYRRIYIEPRKRRSTEGVR